MNAVSRYDRLLISLAMAALGAMVLSGQARAQDQGGAPPMLDRYGGDAQPAPYAPDPWRAPPPRVMPGRALSWAGKSDAAAPTPSAYAPPPPMSAAPTAWAPPPVSSPVYAERRRPTRPVATGRATADYASAPRALIAAPPAPIPVYAPPVHATPTPQAVASAAPLPAAPAPPRAAQAYNGSSVRHYSVHREFGIAPDPTPIPPQFFTATADLSAQSAAEAVPLARTPATQTASGRTGRAATTVAADPS